MSYPAILEYIQELIKHYNNESGLNIARSVIVNLQALSCRRLRLLAADQECRF